MNGSVSFDAETIAMLRWVAIVLAALVALLHVVHPRYGGPGLFIWLNAGYLGDPRPVAFTLGGFALFACALLIYFGVVRRIAYLTAATLALLFLVGYGLWHTVLDHGGFWPYIHAHGHADTHPIVVVSEHLINDVVALVTKTLEAILVGVCLLLFRVDTA